MKTYLVIPAIFFTVFFSCKKTDDATPTTGTTGTNDISALKGKFTGVGITSVAIDGNFLVIKSSATPDHKSPYFGKTDSRYEAYNGTNARFSINPNSIVSQNLTFRIPINPKESTTKSATPGGPIGISLNGVPFFNQYAAMGAALTNEINGFDQYGGHPQQQGQYHYHIEPIYLTSKNGSEAFLGFLLDGFPVYGPQENGKLIANSDLDAYHGHTSKTVDFPNGIYHYHITSADPYINGGGFFGTAGTVSQ